MTHTFLAVLATAGGALLLLGVLWDAFETMILSRRVSRGLRVTTLFYRATWPPWAAAARMMSPGRRRENFLTIYGPLSLVLLIAFWAVALVFAFGLMQWGLGPGLAPMDGNDLWTAVYMSGTSLFTLGLGDVTPRTSAARLLVVVECGTGFAFLALVISYLPVLSQAFSKREVSISLLDARSGSPPTCSELLKRSGLDKTPLELAELLREWERWSAELLESHISFPVLAFYRSQHAFAIARHAVADMCNVLRRRPRPPAADRLPPEELARLRQALELADVRLKTGETTERQLTELRGLYEGHVNALAHFLVMPLPHWVPPAVVRDNWQMTGRIL